MPELTPLYPYQQKGVILQRRFNGRVLLADDMGLGKSIQVLTYAEENNLFPMLIICPAGLKLNWQNEAWKHRGLESVIFESTKPPPIQNGGFLKQPKICIINYEIVQYWLPYLKSLNFKLVVLDECQRIKNLDGVHNGKGKKKGGIRQIQAKSVREIVRTIRHRVGISGTPLTSRPIELFPIANLLWPQTFRSRFSFAMKYCDPVVRPWGWEFKGAKNTEELNHILRQKGMIRRRKVDVLDQLPEKTRCLIPLPISNPKEYQTAVGDFVNWLKAKNQDRGERAEKAETLTKMGYLKRLAAQLKYDAVVEWTQNFLEESNEKLILFGVHKAILRPLYKQFQDISVLVDGDITGYKRQRAVDVFNSDSQVRLFIGNIQAAGVGWNGTAAANVAFAEMAWTPGEHTQAEDRAHRIGQLNAVMCYYLVAHGTIEEMLCKLIQRKQKVLDSVLDGRQVESFDIFDELKREMLRGAA